MNHIYIIGTETPPYKIGFSRTPEKRIKSLQTGFPTKLTLHYIKEVSDENVRNIEKQIHNTIGYRKTKGEWFDIDLEQAKTEVDFAIIKYEKI